MPFSLAPKSKTSGVTLVEMVLGLGILAIVLVITLQVFSQILRIQGDQEALISAQTRLRRVSEIIAQDVRGAVFGGIINQPRASDTSGFSVALLSADNGYPASYSTVNDTAVKIIGPPSPPAFAWSGNYAFLYSGEKGIVLPITPTPTATSGNVYTMSVGCAVTLPYVGNSATTANNTLLFPVKAASYWLDTSTNTLRYQELGQSAQDVAYDITAFNIDYVYQSASGTLEVNPSDYKSNNAVQLLIKRAGGDVRLVRLRITLSAREKSFGAYKTRTYTSELSLANNGILNLNEVAQC